MKIRSAYQPHDRHAFLCVGKSRTKQAFEKETNVNSIMERYRKTGLIEHVNEHQGQYGDFINFDDYHSSLNKIHDANNMFMDLPADLRAQFNNSPAEFLGFVQDPNNQEELIELGLAKRRPDVPSVSQGDQEAVVEETAPAPNTGDTPVI